MQKWIGKTLKVLVDGVSKSNKAELVAHTEQERQIVFKADKSMIGKFVNVHIDSLHGNTFRGTLS